MTTLDPMQHLSRLKADPTFHVMLWLMDGEGVNMFFSDNHVLSGEDAFLDISDSHVQHHSTIHAVQKARHAGNLFF